MQLQYLYLAVYELGQESLTHFGMDVVNPLAIWTGMGTGNEE